MPTPILNGDRRGWARRPGGAALGDVLLAAGRDLVGFESVFSQARHVERFIRYE